jgi:DNA-binding protein H-NS
MNLPANFASMSVEELWKMHEEIAKRLEAKMLAEKAKILAEKKMLERRLNRLQPDRPNAHRPYPPVVPKFANPDEPSQVWSGRGKQPQWVKEKLASGLTLEDLSIGAWPRSTHEHRPDDE